MVEKSGTNLHPSSCRLLTLMMECRNEAVSRQLQEQYRDAVLTDELKVFSVGNHLYWDHRNKHRTVSLPYLNLSGIIELRKHCLSIVASSQRQAVNHYIIDEVPDFLARVDNWVQSGARCFDTERREAIIRTLDQVASRLSQVRLVSSSHPDYNTNRDFHCKGFGIKDQRYQCDIAKCEPGFPYKHIRK